MAPLTLCVSLTRRLVRLVVLLAYQVYLMAFRPPTFNLNVNIWRTANAVTNPPDVATTGNLSPGRRTLTMASTPGAAGGVGQNVWLFLSLLPMELLLPAGTDIRYNALGGSGVSTADCVEVPAGSGRFYVCMGVDDVGKGFPNEYRLALLFPLTDAMRSACSNPWTAPSVTYPIP